MAYFSVRELGARGEPEMRTVFYFSLVSSVVRCALADVQRHARRRPAQRPAFARRGQFRDGRPAGHDARLHARQDPDVGGAGLQHGDLFQPVRHALFWGEVLDASAWFAIGLIILSGIAATHFSRASPVEQD
jgi:hypothetical protein